MSDAFTWLPTVSSRISALYLSDELSDVSFVVGNEEKQARFSGHKLILSTASPVFRKMFTGPFKEKLDYELKLPDVDPDAFESVLSLIYRDRILVESVAQVANILYITDKYMLSQVLYDRCREYLTENTNASTFFDVYKLIRMYFLNHKDSGSLIRKCWLVLLENGEDLLQQKAFTKLDIGTVMCILSRDSLRLSSEVITFYALINWAIQQCSYKALEPSTENQRKMIGDLIYLVRYNSMTWKTFQEGPGRSDLLTDEEKLVISKDVKSWLPVSCNMHMNRISVENQREVCMWDRTKPSEIRTIETFVVVPNQDVVIIQVGFVAAPPSKTVRVHLAITNTKDQVLQELDHSWIPHPQYPQEHIHFVDLDDVFMKSGSTYKIHTCVKEGKLIIGCGTSMSAMELQASANGRQLQFFFHSSPRMNITQKELESDKEWCQMRSPIPGPGCIRVEVSTRKTICSAIQRLKFVV